MSLETLVTMLAAET